MKKTPVILIIMDGVGVSKIKKGNAVLNADTPNIDHFFTKYPYTTLKASGEDVGVPKGFMGSSEVGHSNLGAGRKVLQEEVRIDRAIRNRQFFKDKAFLAAIKNVKQHNSRMHIMGLLQDKGVHALNEHLFALMKLCHQNKIKPYLHIFTDGRDSLPTSAISYFRQLEKVMKKYPAEIKTITGRYFAMDRDNRWKRTKLAYEAIDKGEGFPVDSYREALSTAYRHGETDEFIKPKIIGEYKGLETHDSLIFFNYRSDRGRQLTQALLEPKFARFKRQRKSLFFVGMTRYYLGMPGLAAFEKPHLANIMGEFCEKHGLKQLRIAETEKYAHVTYFFNNENPEPFIGEKRILIPSPKVATYDLQPEMSAYKICQAVCKEIAKKKYDFIVLNYANGDMVGHTGVYKAAIKAVEVVDECVKRVVDKMSSIGGISIITADHGNAEKMLDSEGQVVTSHTTNPVPFCIVGYDCDLKSSGKLGDVAPTILEMWNEDQPKEMDGNSLIR
ncbi:MAG: 2,3-bisphosphoglycerate-independent phosphoglycerate mutase [archaeon]